MSDYLTGLSNQYTSSDYSNVNKLKDTITNTDYSKATEEELMEACKSFESYFIEQAFKGMEKMVPDNEEDSSMTTSYTDMFKDKLYQEYAESATDRGDGIGIATMLYEQMKRNYDV